MKTKKDAKKYIEQRMKIWKSFSKEMNALYAMLKSDEIKRKLDIHREDVNHLFCTIYNFVLSILENKSNAMYNNEKLNQFITLQFEDLVKKLNLK